MRQPLAILTALSVVATLACEPLDPGGGGGVGGRLALVRSGVLVVSQDDGSAERTLTERDTSATPAFAPNGQRVAFAWSAAGDETARGIYVLPFAGLGAPEALAVPNAGETFSSPAFSPDGGTVVFVAKAGANTRLLKVDASGGTAEDVAGGDDLNHPAFVDSGTLLVSKSDRSLQRLSLATGALSEVGAESRYRGAVSPDGARIAYADADGIIVVRELDTGAETPLARTGHGDSNPAFSPDGELVAFEAKNKIYAARANGEDDAEVLQSGSSVAWAP